VLAAALGLAVLAMVVSLAGYGVRLVDLLDVPGAGTDVLEISLDAVGALLLVVAYGVGRRAFQGLAGRWRLLALGALVAAGGYALHAVADWIDFADTANDLFTTTNHEVASILRAFSETVIVLVALAVAVAFRRSRDVPARDGRLAGAACLAVGVSLLSAGSAVFFAFIYFDYDLDSVARALLLEAVGAAALALAAVLGTVAFLRSRRSAPDEAATWPLDREQTLALAAAVYALGTLAIAIGEGLAIGEGFGLGVDGALATSYWLLAAARLVIAAAALVAATAFALGGWGEDARVRVEELIRVVRGRPRQQ
jgi:hypothetical protein